MAEAPRRQPAHRLTEPSHGAVSPLPAIPDPPNPPHPLRYNFHVIPFARAVMSVMVWLFFIGVAGSLLVIVISFVEDLTELLGKE